jgi:alpha-1,6-mannosyltransferase
MAKLTFYLLLLASFLGYILIGYFTERSNFSLLISLYAALFVIYFFLLKNKNLLNFNILLVAGILFRCCLIFSIPALSDDFYRFIWDGRLQELGFNPFDYSPSELLTHSTDPFLKQIFPLLNSPDYFSVYPQFCQILFRIAAFIGQDNLYLNVISLKSMIFISELGTINLLHRLLNLRKKDPSLLLIYVLNPLVIIELTGNIHFEAFMISLSLLSVLLIFYKKIGASASALALAIQAKILPLIFIPVLLRKIGFKKIISWTLIVLIMLILMGIDLLIEPKRIQHISESLNLYYGKFEFNGGIYLIFRSIGWWIMSYNPIAIISKLLIFLSLAAMLYVYLTEKDMLSGLFWVLCIYLLFGAVVNPWYLTPLIALSIFHRYRFVLLWSALIPLTYITYKVMPYSENYWIIGVEYALVLTYLLWEIKVKKAKFRQDEAINNELTAE